MKSLSDIVGMQEEYVQNLLDNVVVDQGSSPEIVEMVGREIERLLHMKLEIVRDSRF